MEKEFRQKLAEEKIVLEYKLREVGALNTLFQKHLEFRRQVETAHQELLKRLKELLSQPPGRGLREQLRHIVEEAEKSSPPPPDSLP